MSRLTRRAMLGIKVSGKTYAEFQAHIATLATSGSLSWATNAEVAGAWRTTAAAAAGIMYATSWNNSYYYQSRTARVVQHALPSEAVFNDQVTNGREMFIRLVSGFDRVDFASVTRNGYTSSAYNDGSFYPVINVTELIRWDGTKAWKSNPSIGGAETEYTW